MKKTIIKIVKFLIILIIVSIFIYILIGIYKENKIKIKEESRSKTEIDKTLNEEEEETIEKINIPDTYSGFKVAAKLIIPKIDLETYVLDKYTTERMDLCPTKFWGSDPNEIGNFCITGHNYKKENMFYNLIDLSVGDEFYLLDNKNGKFTYTIYDIYKVKPENTNCLNQNTNGKREVTLITCVNYSNTRLIIKATQKGI